MSNKSRTPPRQAGRPLLGREREPPPRDGCARGAVAAKRPALKVEKHQRPSGIVSRRPLGFCKID